MRLISKNKVKLIELCEKHYVQALYIFGSITTNNFNDKSDIDILVQFESIDYMTYFDNYMDLKEKLEQLFNRSIDLVENQSIKNPIFRNVVDREKQLIYERKSA